MIVKFIKWTYLIYFAVLLFLCGLVKANNGTYQVPMQYVTERHIFGDAFSVNYFAAHLCGGCLFDNQLATVSLNLQKQPWNETLQDILKASVQDANGKLITTNEVKGVHEQTFSFTYYRHYGDLNIRVENGAGSGMIYSLALKFRKVKGVAASDCENRWSMSWLESRAHMKYMTSVAARGEQLHELVPIFKMSDPYAVKSNDLTYLQLDYCFPHSSGRYNVTVSVIANDEQSAFATYACPVSTKDCEPGNSPFHDTSGSAVNLVHVNVAGPPDIGPVTVVVRGDGRYGQMNTFTLAASKYTAV